MLKSLKIVFMLFLAMSVMSYSSSFPKKNLSLVIPYSAGGGTDQVGRSIALSAQEVLGKPIVSINKTGAGGAIGFTAGAKARADGYTLSVMTVGISTLPHLGNMKVDYRDFTPIVQLNTAPASVVVNADSDFKTLADLVNYAKANPHKIQFGNSGVGAIWHLATAMFAEKTKIDIVHVPFSGSSTQTAALLGHHVDAIVVSPSEIEAQVKAGKLRVLGVMSEERVDGFKDVPTLTELGYDLVVKTRRGIGVPKKTPAAVVAKLRAAFVEAANTAQFKDLMAKGRLHVEILDGEAYNTQLAKDDAMFKDVIESLHLNK